MAEGSPRWPGYHDLTGSRATSAAGTCSCRDGGEAQPPATPDVADDAGPLLTRRGTSAVGWAAASVHRPRRSQAQRGRARAWSADRRRHEDRHHPSPRTARCRRRRHRDARRPPRLVEHRDDRGRRARLAEGREARKVCEARLTSRSSPPGGAAAAPHRYADLRGHETADRPQRRVERPITGRLHGSVARRSWRPPPRAVEHATEYSPRSSAAATAAIAPACQRSPRASVASR